MAKFSSQYETAFSEAFNKLNTTQRQAVEHIEGPVLVIAGPGTGKTQILATRIGKILQQTDTPPHGILCLTYTDTGRVEMRNRLFSLIGPAAYRVHIHTFHSFCNEVIQDNVSYFGRQNLELISDLEEMVLYKELLNNLPTSSPLKRYKDDINFEAGRLKKLYERYKKENWNNEKLNEKIDVYLNDLPNREEYVYKRNSGPFKKGELKTAAIQEEKERMEKLREAINLYPAYEELMRKRGRYTFSDMILWVLKAFEENNNMLLNYQERYLYFLVDEFQDTSGAQKKLLDMLISYWDTPNVFVVGDDDQSIFSFQDANVKNIRDFAMQYSKGLKQVILTENYRSTQNILDAARTLIEHNIERLVKDNSKNLVASNPSLKDLNIPPQIIEYPNSAHEAIGIAHKIEELITQRNVRPSEVAVIYRNHKQVQELVVYLEKKNIAYNMKRETNLLELPFVQKIFTILEYIAAETKESYSGDFLLFEILHYDFYNIAPIEIAKLSAKVGQERYNSRNERPSLRLAIAKEGVQAAPDLFSDAEEPNELKKISNAFEGLIKEKNNLTLQVFFEVVVREAGILKYVLNSEEKAWNMEVLRCLFNFIKAETHKDPELTLNGFVSMLQEMRMNKINLNLTRITSSSNGVSLITAHGSKGSEYENVFLIGCNKSIWDDKKSSSRSDFKLPDNLSEEKFQADELEESRRLFYVGMTRAKTHLTISYSEQDNENSNKMLERSEFVVEVMEGTKININKQQADEKIITTYLELPYNKDAQPKVNLLDKHYLDSLLENYSLSVTHLNNYLDCPLHFYYVNLIKIPAAKNAAMTFGSSVHFTLQRLFEKMKGNSNVFPSKDEMMQDFKWFMEKNKESFTRFEYKQRVEHGEKILPAYYDYYIHKWNKIVAVELNIRRVEVNGVPLNGKLDKLEFDGKNVNVVDYKTGRYENAKKELKAPDDKEPIGGDYWRQAVFYKILLDNQKQYNWNAVSAEFDFVEPINENEYKTEKIIIRKEDIDIVLGQIQHTWQKIQNHEFNIGCGKEDCEWCRFVRDNNMDINLRELVDEEDGGES